ncbi:restriction endonuclease subunit S [Flavobacterium seoulense]|uniref:Restriction endonuclease subunit M n=1 Tax=Flavobacterium seoulense TaxID=1492738 RepID=A0A066WI14_9FLAO|nr:restriction endonuclease subunit S [Flavobacterium seoulense]KDN53657.1 restriction endonuclease subunit M [Flavobacterium seoulense]
MKGSCEKIFLQKLSFLNLKDSWRSLYLEDIFDFHKGSLFSKNDISENGIGKCIHYGELFTIYNAVISKVISKTNTKGFKSKVGDILMPSSDVTPLGLATASTILEDNIVLGGDINILRPKVSVNSIFMSYLLNFEKKKIIELVSGTTIKHIYNKDLKQIKVCIPIIEEQTKIADFLSSIQEKIDIEKQILEKLELQKKFLLTNLFV